MDRIQRLVPTAYGGDDFVGVGGPGDGFGLLVVIVDEAIDGGLQVADALEGTAFAAGLGEDGEKPSTAFRNRMSS